MLTQSPTIIAIRVEACKRLRQSVCRLRMEKRTRYPLYHRLKRSASRISDNRPPCRIGFKRSETKILLGGNDKSPTRCVEAPQLIIGDTTEETHGRPSEGFETRTVWSFTGNKQG